MSSEFLTQLPLGKCFFDGYAEKANTLFPGGGKVNYADILRHVHDYLDKNVHPTIQQRAQLKDNGLYLTDHGPSHIEIVLRRVSSIVRTEQCVRDEGTRRDVKYETCLDPYEIFLLMLAVDFHDVGNMYGRDGHEREILKVMEQVESMKTLPWPEGKLIAHIAMCHGGKIEGDKDTIRTLPSGNQYDGEVRYRPQLLAAILRLADELADERSRADNFGLMRPNELPETCLLYHKYAAGLKVSIDTLAGQIKLHFDLHTPDLQLPFKKANKSGPPNDVYLLDEIYERTLKTYSEMVYCGRYMRGLQAYLNEVKVEIDVFQSKHHSLPLYSYTYIIGDSEYPDHYLNPNEALRKLARDFVGLPNGQILAGILSNHQPAI